MLHLALFLDCMYVAQIYAYASLGQVLFCCIIDIYVVGGGGGAARLPGAKTINVFRACFGAQLTICAQK